MAKRQTITTSYGRKLAHLVAEIERERRVQLVVVEGPSMGRSVQIADSALVIGAGSDCDLCIDDPRVSQHHVSLTREGKGFRVTDLSSTNGIFFRSALVGSAVLNVGDTFTIGRTPLSIQPTSRYVDVPPSDAHRLGELVADSVSMRRLFTMIQLAAMSDVTCLIEGETGVGKELVARELHANSPRRKQAFVALDCGALPESLLESALFGHIKGAFTGADRPRKGAFVQASGGTLFLDEIANLTLAAQARLLRALESRKVVPVGADQERDVDVRVIAAANSGIEDLVARGGFRPDLFYRLAVVRLEVPPLRSRPEDIKVIAREILRRGGFEPGELDGDNLATLLSHRWPGNVRELRNVLERAMVLSPGARDFAGLRLSLSGLSQPTDALSVRTDLDFKAAKSLVVDAFEQTYVSQLSARFPGNLSAMARAAGVDRKTIRALLVRHGLSEPPEAES